MLEEPPFVKWVSDPLYGSIPLTQVEVDIIDCRAFQRLRNVGQLGLVSLVFPSATYTRFTHSLGACHLIGEMLERLGESWRKDKQKWQEHRLAMLLHDIGHYAMSHATEEAAKEYYSLKRIKLEGDEVEVDENKKNVFVKHEHVGAKVLEYDDELGSVLKRHGFDHQLISRVFTRAEPTLFGSLVSSDLDADRLDYLMRSSQATGLPYGFHDRDFIMRNLEIVKSAKDEESEGGQDEIEQHVCVKEKAVRAADHFLLARMFDYMQVIFQPVVVAMEQMLQIAVKALLRLNEMSLDEPSVIDCIKSGAWYGMNDAQLWGDVDRVFRTRRSELLEVEALAIERLLLRRPPPLLYSYECIATEEAACREALHDSGFKNGVDKDEILRSTCFHWSVPFQLMTARTHSYSDESESEHKMSKIVRVSVDGKSVPITRIPQSIAGALGDQVYEMARVYYVGADSEFEKAKERMEAIKRDFNLPGRVSTKSARLSR